MHRVVIVVALLAVAHATHLAEVLPSSATNFSTPGYSNDNAFVDAKINRLLSERSKRDGEGNNPGPGPGPYDPRRLNGDVIPLFYKLHFEIDLEEITYNGSVEIQVVAFNTTNEITLHADDLKINRSSSYVSSNGQYAEITNISNVDYDKVTLELSKELIYKKQYTLHLNYTGNVNKFYFKAFTFNDTDKLSRMGFVPFGPTNARGIFPCFDEPNMKAPFSITISHSSQYTAFTNMPVEKTVSEVNTTRKTVSYKTSPEMSTYQVTLAISELSESFSSDRNYVWARKSTVIHLIQELIILFAIERAVVEMERFTNIELPLSKIDHVAVPAEGRINQDPVGWGTLLYSEKDLILHDNSSIQFQSIARTISRAVARQWFGGLVTLDWWDYKWLNEGFSSFFGFYLSDKIGNGKWGTWEQFIPTDFQSAMLVDADPLRSTMLTDDATATGSYNDYFGTISSAKGGSFVRMVAELLTMDKFKTALREYLDTYSFRNANPDDLFKILEKASVEGTAFPKNVSFVNFAKSWTEQAGVPLVNVTRNYETGEVTLTQQRFFEGIPQNESDVNVHWWIPLSWMTGNETVDFQSQKWLRADAENENLSICPGNASFLLNLRSVGYFRVNYDTSNWLYLAEDLRSTPQNFPVENRAQIIDDAYTLAKTGHVNIKVALEILRLLENENDASVWMTGIKVLAHLRQNIEGTAVYPLLEKFSQRLLKSAYSTVAGLPTPTLDEHQKSLLRFNIAPSACTVGVEQCVEDALKNFEEHNQTFERIHLDVLFPTLCGVFKGADESKFWATRNLISQYSLNVQETMLEALANCTSDKFLRKDHLVDILQARSTFPEGLKLLALQKVFESPLLFNGSFEFAKEYFEKLLKKMGRNPTIDLMKKLVLSIRTKSQYDEVRNWVNNQYIEILGESDYVVPAALDTVLSEGYFEWNERHLTDVEEWLKDVTPPTTLPPTTTEVSPTTRTTTPPRTTLPPATTLPPTTRHLLQHYQQQHATTELIPRACGLLTPTEDQIDV